MFPISGFAASYLAPVLAWLALPACEEPASQPGINTLEANVINAPLGPTTCQGLASNTAKVASQGGSAQIEADIFWRGQVLSGAWKIE
jgi:hypothetical protein